MKTDHAFCSFCPNSVSKKEYFAIVLHSSAMFEGRYRTSLTFVAIKSVWGRAKDDRQDFSILGGIRYDAQSFATCNKKIFCRRSAIQPHQTFFSALLASESTSQPRRSSDSFFFSNAFMNRLSCHSAVFRSSSCNRISNSFFRHPPHLRALAIKMSTSKEADASQPVANGVYKPRYIDVRPSPCESSFCLLDNILLCPKPKQ